MLWIGSLLSHLLAATYKSSFGSLDINIWPNCNTPVLTPFALNIYDINIVWNHGKELKAKALPLIDVFCIGDQGDT